MIMDEIQKLNEYLKILSTSYNRKDIDLIKTFNCDKNWPICLYDFSNKNKSNEF